MSVPTTAVVVTPDYASINAVRGICEPWIELWGGDEWGESMLDLHGACHTDYGFVDEDCALFATRLVANLESQYEWMIEEGYQYDFMQRDAVESVRVKCRKLRDHWLEGGNLKSEYASAVAKATIDTMPTWLYDEAATDRWS
jgi:hypothetical protein